MMGASSWLPLIAMLFLGVGQTGLSPGSPLRMWRTPSSALEMEPDPRVPPFISTKKAAEDVERLFYLLRAPDPEGFYPEYFPEFEEELENAYKVILDEAIETVKNEQPEIKVEARLEKGRPSDVIMKVARTENVDLIVMGSRGLGGITGTVLGSTSQAVVHCVLGQFS